MFRRYGSEIKYIFNSRAQVPYAHGNGIHLLLQVCYLPGQVHALMFPGVQIMYTGTHTHLHYQADIKFPGVLNSWGTSSQIYNESNTHKCSGVQITCTGIHTHWCFQLCKSSRWQHTHTLYWYTHSRHGLVNGLDSEAHGKLVYNLLRDVIKVNLPRLVTFDLRNLHGAVILHLGQVVEQVLHTHRISEITWTGIHVQHQVCKLPVQVHTPDPSGDSQHWLTSCKHVYCPCGGATFPSPFISTLIFSLIAPDTIDLSVLFSGGTERRDWIIITSYSGAGIAQAPTGGTKQRST